MDGMDSITVRRLINRLITTADDKNAANVDFECRDYKQLREAIKKHAEASKVAVSHLLRNSAKAQLSARRLVLRLMNHFFVRCHAFRLATLAEGSEILPIFCETDPILRPLPLPVADANELKIECVEMLKEWHAKFGPGYDELRSLYALLLAKHKLFKMAEDRATAERERQYAREARIEEKRAKVLKSVELQYNRMRSSIDRCITEAHNAVDLLVPRFGVHDDSGEYVQATAPSSDVHEQRRLHGYNNNEVISITINSTVPQITVSENNEALVTAVRDSKALLLMNRTFISKSLFRLASVGATASLVKELTEKRNQIANELSRINDLQLPRPTDIDYSSGSTDEEDEFEDVPEPKIDFYTPYSKYIPIPIIKELKRRDEELQSKPSTSQESQCSSSKPEIPVLPFGLDLKYWGDKPPAAMEMPKNNADCHRFWRAPDDDGTAKGTAEVYTMRMFTYTEPPRKIEHTCNARLPTGKLCPRQDMVKCPFHGLIIPRDEEGFPLEPQSSNSSSITDNKKRDDKAEEEYLKDVEAATGASLRAPTDGKGKMKLPRIVKKKPESEATSIRKNLEKKLFNKKSMQRVADHLGELHRARMERKFGHQYVHAMSRK